jgi:molecular chaperone DnaK (HSP70)
MKENEIKESVTNLLIESKKLYNDFPLLSNIILNIADLLLEKLEQKEFQTNNSKQEKIQFKPLQINQNKQINSNEEKLKQLDKNLSEEDLKEIDKIVNEIKKELSME